MRWTKANVDKPQRCPCCHRAGAVRRIGPEGWSVSHWVGRPWSEFKARMEWKLINFLRGFGYWQCPVCKLRWHIWWKAKLWQHHEMAEERYAVYPDCEWSV